MSWRESLVDELPACCALLSEKGTASLRYCGVFVSSSIAVFATTGERIDPETYDLLDAVYDRHGFKVLMRDPETPLTVCRVSSPVAIPEANLPARDWTPGASALPCDVLFWDAKNASDWRQQACFHQIHGELDVHAGETSFSVRLDDLDVSQVAQYESDPEMKELRVRTRGMPILVGEQVVGIMLTDVARGQVEGILASGLPSERTIKGVVETDAATPDKRPSRPRGSVVRKARSSDTRGAQTAPNVVAVLREEAYPMRTLGLATFLSDSIAITTTEALGGRDQVRASFSSDARANRGEVTAVDAGLGLALLKFVRPGPEGLGTPLPLVPPPECREGELSHWTGHWYNPNDDGLGRIEGYFEPRGSRESGEDRLRLHVSGMKERGVEFVVSGGGVFVDGALVGIMTDYAKSYANAIRADAVLSSDTLKGALPLTKLGGTGEDGQVPKAKQGKSQQQGEPQAGREVPEPKSVVTPAAATVAHISRDGPANALATLLSPRYAVCSLTGLRKGDTVTVHGFGEGPKARGLKASCVFEGTEMPYQLLEVAEPAPREACAAILQLTPSPDSGEGFSTFWSEPRSWSFDIRDAEAGPPYGLGDTKDLLHRLRVTTPPRGSGAEWTRGTPVLRQGALVGIMADTAPDSDGFHCMVPAINMMNDRGWYRLVLGDLEGPPPESDEAAATMGLLPPGGQGDDRVYELSDSFCSESTRYILMASFELSSYAGKAALDERHLLACGLLVGARQAAFRPNKDYAFVLLARELGTTDQDKLASLFRHQGSHLVTPDEFSRLVDSIAGSVAVEEPVSCAVSPEVAAILDIAADIAGRTQSRPEDTSIHQRHLLAGVLVDARRTNSHAAKLFERLEIAPDSLGRQLARAWGGLPSDSAEAWDALFPPRGALDQQPGETAETTTRDPSVGDTTQDHIQEIATLLVDQIPGVISDAVPEDVALLEDRLGVDAQAAAFARVIMDRGFDPPLAVGLFGDWGSGKTYFMGLIRKHVERLATAPMHQLEGSPQPPPAYCTNVVPIVFNAWHYIDSNLWASLVTHIFERLAQHYLPEGAETEQIERERERLLKETETAQRMREEAALRRREAEQAVDAARESLAEAQAEVASGTFALKSFLRSQIDGALADSGVRSQLDDALGALSLPESEVLRIDTQRLVETVASVQGKVRVLLRWLATTKWWIILLWLAAPPLAVFLLPLVASYLEGLKPLFEQVSWKVASVIAAVSPVFAKVCTQLAKADRLVDKVVLKKREFDRKKQELWQQHSADIHRLEEAVGEARRECEVASRKVEVAETRLVQAQQSLAELSLGRRLYEFIDARCRSGDYRAHLTIISLIREDFRRLSGLLRHSRENESRENGQAKHEPIERIVLFIDDLDRCPAERVVEVLEAVHLLLAFPLFVVVVGVDHRWVENALIEKYLKQPADAGDSRQAGCGSYMTPQNYLEKIFQIPYQIPRMRPTGFSDLADALLPPADAEIETSLSQIAAEARTETKEGIEDDVGVVSEKAEATASDERTDEPTEGPSGTGTTQAEADREPAGGEDEPEGEPTSMAEAVQIHPEETEFLKGLHWAATTPRVLKRIANIYRVIRAHEAVSDSETHARFLGKGDDQAEYRIVLLLLIVQHAFGDAGRKLTSEIEAAEPDTSWVDWLDGVWFDEGTDGTQNEDKADPQGGVAVGRAQGDEYWERLMQGLNTAQVLGIECPMERIQYWLAVVSRYSFKSAEFRSTSSALAGT